MNYVKKLRHSRTQCARRTLCRLLIMVLGITPLLMPMSDTVHQEFPSVTKFRGKHDSSGKRPKIVLYWLGQSFSKGQDFAFGLGCRKRCLFTTSRSLLAQADAVLLHKNLRQLQHRKWPKRHNRNQLFVATRFEPPTKDGAQEELYNTLNSSVARNYFNVTFSYRKDADIVLKYHEFLPRTHHSIGNLDLPTNNKKKQIVWIVSNCDTPIQREVFVKQLMRYVDIDVYGDCGVSLNDTCNWKWTNLNNTGEKTYCLHDIVKNYKFYLALENTLCTDYLTEKAAQFMNTPSVPIVMSLTKLENFLPPHSYINVFDFKSIKDLADYILYLDKNFDEYLKYFAWRTKWRVETHLITRPKAECDLCDLLYTNYSKTYHNLADWFAGPHV